jgi:hypothetical protein
MGSVAPEVRTVDAKLFLRQDFSVARFRCRHSSASIDTSDRLESQVAASYKTAAETLDHYPKDPLVALSTRVLHGIASNGSDQTHVKSENPLVARCKFSALTNSQQHHGTLFDTVGACPVGLGINHLL